MTKEQREQAEGVIERLLENNPCGVEGCTVCPHERLNAELLRAGIAASEECERLRVQVVELETQIKEMQEW